MLKKEFAKALLNFDYAVNTEKFDIKVLLGRCRCHLAMGQFRKAFHDADRVVDHGPPPSLIKGRRWRRNRRLTAK